MKLCKPAHADRRTDKDFRPGGLHNPRAWITATHGDRAQGALKMVGVDRNVRVIQEDTQSGTSFAGIRQCFGQSAAGQEAVLFKGICDPEEEAIDPGLGMLLSPGLFVGSVALSLHRNQAMMLVLTEVGNDQC